MLQHTLKETFAAAAKEISVNAASYTATTCQQYDIDLKNRSNKKQKMFHLSCQIVGIECFFMIPHTEREDTIEK